MLLFLQIGIKGSLLIIFTICLRRLFFSRVPKRFFVLLWAIVLFRLLFPFSIPINWKPFQYVWNLEDAFRQLPHSELDGGFFASPPDIVYPSELAVNHPTLVKNQSGATLFHFQTITALWLIVAATIAIAILTRHLKCVRKYKTALPLCDKAAEGWLNSHPLLCKARLRISDQIHTPLTYGIFRPIILIPTGLDLKENELFLILEHEWNHIRYWDILIKYALYLAVCLHWFNPLVWISSVLLCRDLELACDEEVVRHHNDSVRKTYALLLIWMSERQNDARYAGICFTKHSEIEERIRTIMIVRKKSKKTVLLGLLTAFFLIPAFTSMAQYHQPARETSAQITAIPHRIIPAPAYRNSILGRHIAELATRYVGGPYRYGGTDLFTGVDCSGFITALFKQAGISLPIGMKNLAREGAVISRKEISAGDLVFYGNTDKDPFDSLEHVALYLGGNQVIHASNARDGIKISEVDYREISLIVRILHE